MRHLGSVRVQIHVHDRKPQQRGIEATELDTRHIRERTFVTTRHDGYPRFGRLLQSDRR